MTESYIAAAFHKVCEQAVPAKANYVSLYVSVPFYGGPEEGGWWGEDVELVAYQKVSNAVEAEALKKAVRKMAEELSEDARRKHNRACAQSVEWVEMHDPMADVSDYFPETDGELRYWVTTEERPGEHVSQGSRYYE